MAKRSAEDAEDFVGLGLRYTKEQFEEALGQTEKYVRENPGRSLLYAFGAGLILNRLPVGRLLSGVSRLLLFALKPAILVYGATKLYEATQEDE